MHRDRDNARLIEGVGQSAACVHHQLPRTRWQIADRQAVAAEGEASAEIVADIGAESARLKSVMEKFGFKNYENEWWHFTLANEPYPDTYFDVEVK